MPLLTAPANTHPNDLVLLRPMSGRGCSKLIGKRDGVPCVLRGYASGESRWLPSAHRVETWARFVEVLDAASRLGTSIAIRGCYADGTQYDPERGVLRRLTTTPSAAKGPWLPAARAWLPVDLDGAEVPPGSPVEQVASAVTLLGPLAGASCWYQLTSGHGLDGNPGKLRARLWFLCAGPVSDAAAAAWAETLPACLHADVSIYRPVQPIYLASPEIDPSLGADPVGGERTGVLEGWLGDLAPTLPEPTPKATDAPTAAAAAGPGHPVEIANAIERLQQQVSHGSRHHHAMGAAVELLALGADGEQVAEVLEDLIRRQGREPQPNEISNAIMWAGEKIAGGDARAPQSAAKVFPETPPDAVATDPPPEDAREFATSGFTRDSNVNARIYLRQHYAWPHAEEPERHALYTMVRLAQVDHVWTGRHYQAQEDGALDLDIQARVAVSVSPTLAAIRRLAFAPATPLPPYWRETDAGDPPPSLALAFANGVLDLQAWALGETRLMPHDPRLLTTSSLAYDFQPGARCPEFDAWLTALFDDEESRQEYLKMLGYCFLADNPKHRIFMLIGHPRAGKGVTLRLLERLNGATACAATSLQGLGERFGLANLLGARVATVGEMNDHRSQITMAAIDRIKSISGGDRVEVDRKGKDIVHAVLGAKFVIACNQFPALLDASGAILARMSVLHFTKGHTGAEDWGLEQRLANELPGIALRALGALRGLMRGDRFSNPPNVEKLLAEIRRQVSPVLAFVEDYLRTDQGQEAAWISKAEIYAAYRVHAARCGVDRPPAMSRFFGELRAACPGLADHRPRLESGERPQALSAPGLAWSPEGLRLLESTRPPFPKEPTP
jgi:putative DNA primase/helicase